MAKVIRKPNLLSRIEKVLKEELSNGTRAFIKDLHSYCKRKGGLTEAQLRHFEKTESAFSAEAKAKRENWIARYDEEKKKLFKTLCEYYKTTPYYANIVYKALGDETFVPTEKQFNQITNNPYARKIIVAMESPALYAPKTLVRFRKTNRVRWDLKDKMAFVVAHDVGVPTSPAKGSKLYKVLPFGSKTVIMVEERDIKVVRKTKKK